MQSRADLIKYAKKNKIQIPKDKKGAPPFSVDDNIFHTSTEGKVLERILKILLLNLSFKELFLLKKLRVKKQKLK